MTLSPNSNASMRTSNVYITNDRLSQRQFIEEEYRLWRDPEMERTDYELQRRDWKYDDGGEARLVYRSKVDKDIVAVLARQYSTTPDYDKVPATV